MPWRTECNWSIWQWPECSCVPESRNQSRYTFVLRVIARQCWVSWKLPLVGGIQRFILNTTFRWVLKLTPLITLIITIQIEIWFVFSLKSSIYFSTCEPEISEFISRTDAVGYNLKRVNYHLYYNKNTIHSFYEIYFKPRNCFAFLCCVKHFYRSNRNSLRNLRSAKR